MVGIIAPDTARYSMFSIALTQLRVPVNTRIQFALTSDRILGRNKLAKMAVDEGMEWLLFLDDDHTFPSDLLTRLLAREVDVVGSLYLQRAAPFLPIAYATKTDEGVYIPIDLHSHGSADFLAVAAVGTGGMLIRTEVFRELEYPWFEHGRASEDLIFCDMCWENEIGVHVDLGCRLGHLSPSALHASHSEENGWEIAWALADGFSASIELPHIE